VRSASVVYPEVVLNIRSQRYIDEQDAVREILMALQGLKNIILGLIDGTYKVN
jgi:gamma-tubulin complex component 5